MLSLINEEMGYMVTWERSRIRRLEYCRNKIAWKL